MTSVPKRPAARLFAVQAFQIEAGPLRNTASDPVQIADANSGFLFYPSRILSYSFRNAGEGISQIVMVFNPR